MQIEYGNGKTRPASMLLQVSGNQAGFILARPACVQPVRQGMRLEHQGSRLQAYLAR